MNAEVVTVFVLLVAAVVLFATVTVGAMFILSAGLFKTGAVNFVGAR